MAVKRKGNPNHSKENLTWKMNVLAAKTGEDTHIEQAKMAAFGKRHQGEHSEENDNSADQEKYIKEFNEVKKKKLETKLFHIRKEIKAGLKKSKALESTKLSRKLRKAQESTTDSVSGPTESSGKIISTQDVERFQKELDVMKTIDIELLGEKALSNFIRKNSTLKKDVTITTLLITTTSSTTNTAKKNEESTSITENDKVLIGNVEGRLLGNKALTEPLKKSIGEMEMLLLAPDQRKLVKENKRKVAATEQQSSIKRQKQTDKASSSSAPSSSSLFMDSLGGDDNEDSNNNNNNKDQSKKKKKLSSADWEDPDFDKYYNGKGASEKANRPGQSQRRRKWEAIHGDKAKHLTEGKLSSRDQREMKKQKRLQKEALRAGKKDNGNSPSNNIQRGNSMKQKEENLEEFHPSWQAKRQQQEMMAKALSGKGTGNKIVFDDAD